MISSRIEEIKRADAVRCPWPRADCTLQVNQEKDGGGPARPALGGEADNRRLIKRAYQVLNARDLDSYENLIDNAYVVETVASPTPIRGREAVYHLIEMYFKAFPDFHQDLEQMIASDDGVVSRWQVTGTHTGEFNDIPATNRRVSVPGCMVSEIRNGRIVKTFISCDQLAVLQRLGVAIGKTTGSE